MFIELVELKTKKRMSLNLDVVMVILETDEGTAAISIAGARLELPAAYDDVCDAVRVETD